LSSLFFAISRAVVGRPLRCVAQTPSHFKGKKKQRIAVVGGGIAGCGAAWALQKAGHEVVLYEERENLGGNAKTFQWDLPGKPITGKRQRKIMLILRPQCACLAQGVFPQL
jgi:NADPH-dependent 2,4-dienoyl-CoA reductase/sulfur reductase-like enzyme